jgi:phosphoglycolate phosphatase-like HAD superfamily hydrolase
MGMLLINSAPSKLPSNSFIAYRTSLILSIVPNAFIVLILEIIQILYFEFTTKALATISISIMALMLMTQDFSNCLFGNTFEITRVSASTSAEPLPSWNDGKIKQTIISFIKNVTDPDNNNYVPVENRTATFDNDGTLWSEKPVYFQVYYVLDLIKNNGTLQQIPVIKKVLANFTTNSNDSQGTDITEKDVMDMVLSTVPNVPQIEYDGLIKQWIETARHPQTGKLFKNMVFKPMLELISYLEDNNFKVFIVTGGGIDFVRALSDSVYGVPPERVIGSNLKYVFKQTTNGTYAIFHLPEIDKINDEYGKPENIALHSGQVPNIAVGNANGDLQMFQYANDNNIKGKSLILLVHHDDPLREYSYDKKAEKVLEESKRNNWNIISMKDDFKDIYPVENVTGS